MFIAWLVFANPTITNAQIAEHIEDEFGEPRGVAAPHLPAHASEGVRNARRSGAHGLVAHAAESPTGQRPGIAGLTADVLVDVGCTPPTQSLLLGNLWSRASSRCVHARVNAQGVAEGCCVCWSSSLCYELGVMNMRSCRSRSRCRSTEPSRKALLYGVELKGVWLLGVALHGAREAVSVMVVLVGTVLPSVLALQAARTTVHSPPRRGMYTRAVCRHSLSVAECWGTARERQIRILRCQ